MEKYWIIPVITVYIYAATILTKYGYLSYFDIPSTFIESSLKENIIYFFQLFQIALGVAGFMKWWMILIGIILIFICFIYFYSIHVKFRSLIVIGILIITLFGFNYFGKIIAENTEQYYVVSEECPESEQHTIYAIPIFYNQNAIVVTVNKENNKMIGGFKILDISGLSCAIKFKNIGVIND